MIHYITSNGIGNAWVANELCVIQRAGIPFALHAMRPPTSTHHKSKWAEQLNDSTRSIYPLPPIGMIVSILCGPVLFKRHFWAALVNAVFGKRESLRARIACLAHFFVACHWSRKNRSEEINDIHSQWIHSCGSIAMYAAWLLDKPFSFTGHGADLWRDRVALRDKIKRADFIICISNFHRTLYLKEGARPEQLRLAYCGIDPNLFVAQKRERTSSEPFRILSSGRLVEKKGFAYLIQACDILRSHDFEFECVIGGSGELDNHLRHEIRARGLDDYVTVTGEAIKQEEIPEFMHGGDVYCLPCVWANDNDADGLPQMLMEAMACGCPVISTRLVGIPDLIVDGETGILVEPNDPEQIADAIMRLAENEALASQLRENGRRIIEDKFNLETSLEPLIREFRKRLDSCREDVEHLTNAEMTSNIVQQNTDAA